MFMQVDWKKYHRFQEKENYCGVAVIQMILESVGINKSQEEIARDVFIPWWGVSQQIMLAYLSRYFITANFKNNSNTSDILSHLRKNHAIILNWWDDLDEEFEDGHYSIVSNYDIKTKMLTLIDPSVERSGIWDIKYSEFKHKWYDTLTLDNKIWTTGWMLWINLNSKR